MIKIENNMPILCDEIVSNGENLDQLLKLGERLGVLINTYHMRNIGKTHSLIKFAKENGYIVVEHDELQAKALREREQYELIYGVLDIDYVIGKEENKNVVIDEGVELIGINLLKISKYNIITGFYIPKEEEKTFRDQVGETLMEEIKALNPKLKKVRDDNEFGTYKNLINAYREVLDLLTIYKFDLK